MAAQETLAEPLFDPDNIGESLDKINGSIPIHANWLTGLLVGETMSRRQGTGAEIDGIRDYVVGDEPRHIDWKQSARDPNGILKVRQHYADITPALWVVTDVLQSKYKANAGYFSEQQLALSAIMGTIRLADQQSMPHGIVAANNNQILSYRAPVSGRRNILETAERLVDTLPAETSQNEKRRFWQRQPELEIQTQQISLSEVLTRASKLCTASVVMVVSDFRDSAFPDDEPNGWQTALQTLKYKKHNDILAVELTNLWDSHLPEKADTFSLEGVDVWLGDKEGKAIRNRYAELSVERQLAIDKALDDVNAVHLRLSTENPLWMTSLEAQLRENRHRQARSH